MQIDQHSLPEHYIWLNSHRRQTNMTVMERLANSIVVPVVVLDKVEDAIPTAKAMVAGGSWVCPKADIAAGNWDKITQLCINARKAAKGE